MILAYHVILSFYGFWLPNDPRGSWSDWIGSWELFRYGPATKVTTRRNLAREPHDWKARLEAKKALKYPPVILTGAQARAVGRGFAKAAKEGGYVILALAILPDHVHLIIARHDRPIGQIVAHLKARATQELKAEGIHPLKEFTDAEGNTPSPWARNYWKVFIDNVNWVGNAIEYVENNPLKEGKPRQAWAAVTRMT
jgi:REP element-mobilizing transposase RayT